MLLEQKIEFAISGALSSLGYEIVRIKFINTTLQIMIDKPSDKITLEDCSKVSRIVSAIMDSEDIIATHYNLEISSPGISRPLVKKEDYIRFVDNNASFRLKYERDGTKKIIGKILEIRDNNVVVALDKGGEIEISIADIDSAHLVQ